MAARFICVVHRGSRYKQLRGAAPLLFQLWGTLAAEEPEVSLPQVFFLAATNLRSRIDAAALRRFHASVLVPLPEADQRAALLNQLLAKARDLTLGAKPVSKAVVSIISAVFG